MLPVDQSSAWREPALPDEAEVQTAQQLGERYFSLRMSSLREAALHIFGKHRGLDREDYAAIVLHNYQDFDLHRHGHHLLLQQLLLLSEAFEQAIQTVNFRVRQSSGNILSLGCGPGRSAVALIELAMKRRIRCIVFNDLLPSHIDQTREIVRQTYNTNRDRIGPIDLKYVAGDFLDPASPFDDGFDAIIAEWFVTSEIADFSSVETLRRTRRQLYGKIRSLLGSEGVFVEDVPFGDRVAQFYYLARLKTYAILRQMGILQGENHNMLLSNFSQAITPEELAAGVSPMHLRYIPDSEAHLDELRQVGMRRTRSWVSHLPVAVRDPETYRRTFENPVAVRDLFAQHQDVQTSSRCSSKWSVTCSSPPGPIRSRTAAR